MESKAGYSPSEMIEENHETSEVKIQTFEKIDDSSESEQDFSPKKIATCPVIKINTKNTQWHALLDTGAQVSAVSEKNSQGIGMKGRQIEGASCPSHNCKRCHGRKVKGK